MRLLVRGLLLASFASPAFAADVDHSWLRGSSSFPADPPPFQRWNGVYGGGQVGVDIHSSLFTDNGNARIALLAAQDPVLVATGVPALSDLASRNITGLSYGGFFGYNYQIDDTVLGVELNFNATGMNAGTSTVAAIPINNAACPGGTCQITVNASNAVTSTLTDYGTLRIRGGWAYGSFLPYLIAGVAVGWVDTVQTVNVGYSGVITTGPNAGQSVGPKNYIDTAVNHAKSAVGFSAGLGIDYALSRNVFVRGEFEYLQFGSLGPISVSAMGVRTGLGMKF